MNQLKEFLDKYPNMIFEIKFGAPLAWEKPTYIIELSNSDIQRTGTKCNVNGDTLFDHLDDNINVLIETAERIMKF